MSDKSQNIERTATYLEKFSREKILKKLIINPAPTILDIGANEGNTIKEFKEWWPKAKIHAFEPQQECWSILDRIADQEKDIHINKFAVGNDDKDDVVFYSHDLTTGQSGFSKINIESRDSINLNKLRNEQGEKVREYVKSLNYERSVQVRRLCSYLNEKNVCSIDLLKMDTQGYEPEILEGMGEKLASVSVVITELMFFDFYERSLSFSDIERFLLPAGFRLYDISHVSKNPMNGRTDWIDVIYVNVDKLTGK